MIDMSYAITSDVQPEIIVLCRPHRLRDAIDEYLTNWYPDATEISVKRVCGQDWSDE